MHSNTLITAYAVNPFKGSEDGIAWNIIRQLATNKKVIAITRKNNQAPIEAYLSENPLPAGTNLQFEYFDLPYWMRFWKRGGQGALLYHYIWHFAVVFFILKRKFSFDIAHHLNFNNDWTPSFLWLLGKPFVWGPIGHHPKVPYNYIKQYGIKAIILEEVKWFVKKCFWTFDPFLKITKYKAAKIIALNSSVKTVLNVADEKIIVIPAAGNERPKIQNQTKRTGKFQVLSIGRLVSLKGFDITIHAFAKFYNQLPKEDQKNAQLVFIGKGPEKAFLNKIIKKYELPLNSILSKKWMDRRELATYYANSQVFLFPSHEGAGMVVPEALSYGLPVVCFDNYGPGEFINENCGIAIPYGTYETSIAQFANALNTLYTDKQLSNKLAQNAFKQFEEKFTWEQKGTSIKEIYNAIENGKKANLLKQSFPLMMMKK